MLPGTDILERLLEAIPSPVMVADLKGRVLVFNPSAEVALGYGAAEACRHLHVTDVYHRADDARRVLRDLRKRDEAPQPPLRPGGRAFEVTLRARNGELIPVRLRASLLRDAAGAEVATLGLFEDQREHIALGKRLEDAAGQVEASERRAASAMTLAVAAHEMSQPLTAVMGNLEMLLLDRELPGPVRERLLRTADQLERLRRIVSEHARTGRTAGVRDINEGGP